MSKCHNTAMPTIPYLDGESRLSDYEKDKIIAQWQEHQNEAKIIGYLTYSGPYTTISSFLKWYFTPNSYNDLPTSSRPLKIDSWSRRRLVHQVRTYRHQTIREIRDKVAPVVLWTIRRSLRLMGIQKWTAGGRAALGEKDVARRLVWALAYQDWTIAD